MTYEQRKKAAQREMQRDTHAGYRFAWSYYKAKYNLGNKKAVACWYQNNG